MTLAIDDRCWSNRGSCCEIIPEISRLCTAETRELRLAPLFITLLYDDARWVVRAAFENLGPFIATFADTGQICSTRSPAFDDCKFLYLPFFCRKMFHESAAAVCTTHTDLSKLFVEEDVDGFQFMFEEELNIPKELIESYVKIASSCSSIDISYLCAHNFPAIAYTIGRENWPHIKEAYIHLSTDVQCRVRLSLASSIHEVAAIIGEENSAKYLVPAFEMFMKDIEDVRLVLLNHLYDFFKVCLFLSLKLDFNLLTTLATFLHSTTGNDINWRFRHEYASQCILLCDLYDVYDLNKYLSGIALTLANDKVADVRKMGTILLASILGKFVQEEWCLDSSSVSTDESPIPITESFVNDIIKAFARSMTVVNVRIAFARALAGTRGGRAFHGSRDSTLVRKCLETLTSDIDADCRYVARISLGIGDGETIIDVGFQFFIYIAISFHCSMPKYNLAVNFLFSSIFFSFFYNSWVRFRLKIAVNEYDKGKIPFLGLKKLTKKFPLFEMSILTAEFTSRIGSPFYIVNFILYFRKILFT
ncbi:unnamed protein product [Dracunculus medinensis]|uniref:Uncharacterized protein n=1 Tax=Dracunculus medinensis TaxID=318479 RepID=A0A3P7ST11_DRAME|nr:unnamed protein product [Dracunculus medinensis]